MGENGKDFNHKEHKERRGKKFLYALVLGAELKFLKRGNWVLVRVLKTGGRRLFEGGVALRFPPQSKTISFQNLASELSISPSKVTF